MGRNVTEINPECGKRLKKWLTQIGMSQKSLAEMLHITPIHLNNIINGRKHLTYERAVEISEKTKQYDENHSPIFILPEYLICADGADVRTNRDFNDQYAEYWHNNFMSEPHLYKGLSSIVNYYIRMESLNEWKRNDLDAYTIQQNDMNQEYPTISTPDYNIICELTKDYVRNLVHSCIFDRDHSPLWKMQDRKTEQ